jgi:hypothetical protein
METLFGEEIEDEGIVPTYGIYKRNEIEAAAFDYYREHGFPYRALPLHICMQELNKLSAMPCSDKLLKHNLCYQVADTYHAHRFEAAAMNMKSPVESFYDDDKLRRAIELRLDNAKTVPTNLFGELTLVRGTQACSNFRPAFASYLYRSYAREGDTVLDTSTGYGGRLIGYIAAQINGKYIGIDPNTETHNANMRMARDLGVLDQVLLYNLPAEDVPWNFVADRCDFAFTSPPYFKKERYSYDDTQSWVRYGGDAERWRDKFLYKMIELQYAALRVGSYNIVNIAPVKIGKKIYPLDEWTIEAGKQAGFKYIETRRFMLATRFGANNAEEQAFEPVIVFKKEGSPCSTQ